MSLNTKRVLFGDFARAVISEERKKLQAAIYAHDLRLQKLCSMMGAIERLAPHLLTTCSTLSCRPGSDEMVIRCKDGNQGLEVQLSENAQDKTWNVTLFRYLLIDGDLFARRPRVEEDTICLTFEEALHTFMAMKHMMFNKA